MNFNAISKANCTFCGQFFYLTSIYNIRCKTLIAFLFFPNQITLTQQPSPPHYLKALSLHPNSYAFTTQKQCN